jgi:hypothetical protein
VSDDCKPKKGNASAAGGGGAYFLAFVGALVYFLQTASGFWDGVWGVAQALFWPASLVYYVLDYIGA